MSEITTLEEKLAEVIGLAGASQETSKKVESLLDDDSLIDQVKKMRSEAKEIESRCTEVAGQRDGRKTAILDEAQETKNEGVEMMRTYLGEGSDALDGFEFMIMAEAGELGHWEVLRVLNETAAESDVAGAIEWALPIQERHLSSAREGALKLASQEDPNAES